MAKEPKKLDELFHDTLKDIYYAEKKILVALPKMAKAAQNEDLSAAFDKHKTETEGQVSRLEQVFELIDEKPQGKKCAAIEGILEEGQEIMKEYKGSPALDAGLLSAAQAVEHYEISRYGTLRAWAQEMGLDRAAKLLQETLDQEEATDRSLTELAEACVNQEAKVPSGLSSSSANETPRPAARRSWCFHATLGAASFSCCALALIEFLLEPRLAHAIEEFFHRRGRVRNVLFDPGNREVRMRFFHSRQRDARLLQSSGLRQTCDVDA